ncbi:hypothetical protein UFOVP823_12 [uncultured Caudovirales phage]|uniref:Uncharacterized protein n=1 Tax=uncultured Caudovirales phage TaxID=2100421 RepID=A0A6J5P5A5_9CAUD|nr:hypothetical protein UFOVP823_12 [uncultured Caudovirales phage]
MTTHTQAIANALRHMAVAKEREAQMAIRDPIYVPVTVVRDLMGVISAMAGAGLDEEALRPIRVALSAGA